MGNSLFVKSKPENIHPLARATDFHANQKLLSDEQITQLKTALAHETEDRRYSKKYLSSLGIDINRGGILRLWDKSSQEYILYATYKTYLGKSIILGEGAYGRIKLIQNLKTGEFLAIKILRQHIDEKENIKHIEYAKQESYYLNLFGLGENRVISKATFDNEYTKQSFILKLIPGLPLNTVLLHKNLTIEERLQISLSILYKVKEIHDKNFLHRDIKLENILYDPITSQVTLIDFGLMCEANTKFTEIVGTNTYLSPEAKKNGKYSYASDIFALHLVLTAILPLSKDIFLKEYTESFKKIREILTSNEIYALEVLIKKMGNPYPEKRCSLAYAIGTIKELLQKRLKLHEQYLPDSNLNLLDYLPKEISHPFLGTLTVNTQIYDNINKLFNHHKLSKSDIQEFDLLYEYKALFLNESYVSHILKNPEWSFISDIENIKKYIQKHHYLNIDNTHLLWNYMATKIDANAMHYKKLDHYLLIEQCKWDILNPYLSNYHASFGKEGSEEINKINNFFNYDLNSNPNFMYYKNDMMFSNKILLIPFNENIERLSLKKDKTSKVKIMQLNFVIDKITQLYKDDLASMALKTNIRSPENMAIKTHQEIIQILKHAKSSPKINGRSNLIKDLMRIALGSFIAASTLFLVLASKNFRKKFFHTQTRSFLDEVITQLEKRQIIFK